MMQLSVSVPRQPSISSSSLPPLPLFHFASTSQHHVFFVHHPDQQDWVLGVIERLELQLGVSRLQCTCLSQMLATHRNISIYQAVNISAHRINLLRSFSRVPTIDVCTMWGKKTAPFYFCNSLVRTSSIKIIFGTRILQ